MEILNSSVKKRTVLFVSDGSKGVRELKAILEEKYNLVFIEDPSRDFSGIKSSAGALSAAIICAFDAAENDYELFKWISHDSMIEAVPMLIYCGDDKALEAAGGCLERGAIDVLMPPFNKDVVFKRIENAIRLKDSATFLEIEKMLKELPSNIYLKDREGRYIFATHYWHHLDHSDDPDWTIRGKTDIEIRKDKENAVKAMESDMELIRTGVGKDYIIEVNADGIREFLEIIKQPVRDNSGNITGIIALINNVTEQELLRISLEEKAMKDELTGALNRRSFDKYIAGIESGRELPLGIISADCNDLKPVNDTYGHLVGDEYIRMSTVLFRTVLPDDAMIFRTGGDEFIMILPATDEEQLKRYTQILKKEEKDYIIKEKPISISYGVACMEDGGQEVKKYIDIADKMMYKSKKEYKLKKAR